MLRFRNHTMLTAEDRATAARWVRWSGTFYAIALVGLLAFAFAQRHPVKTAAEPAQPQVQQQTGKVS